jgi:hypothetical protein
MCNCGGNSSRSEVVSIHIKGENSTKFPGKALSLRN